MTQTTSAAPAGGSARRTGTPTGVASPALLSPASAPAPTLADRVGSTAAAIRVGMSGTPGHLRVLSAVAVVVSVLFGLGAAQAFRHADGALSRAETNTAQLVRVQALHATLVRANAGATNGFLVGGIEPDAQRADYSAAMREASRLVAEAARSQPADSEALGVLNIALQTYSGQIERARANNRQGFPVGAQYLRVAGDHLRTTALPVLEAVVAANERRAQQEFANGRSAATWLITAGLVSLVPLLIGMIWLARRTRRYLNVPMTIGGIAVLVTLIAGLAGLGGVTSRVQEVRDGPFAATLALAKARTAAYDAKSNESLTLIARGSGAAFETNWANAAKLVTQQLAVARARTPQATQLAGAWSGYTATHTKIRALDNGGDWDGAVSLAVGSGATSANATFDAFDRVSAAVLERQSKAATDDIRAAQRLLPFAGWAGLAMGLLAALGAWWGVSQRLEEYR